MKMLIYGVLGLEKLMMTFTLFLLCILFGTPQVVTGTEYYDSSYYKIINDLAKCKGNLRLKFLKVFINFTHILCFKLLMDVYKNVQNVLVNIFYCVDLGDDWDKVILEHVFLELRFLHRSFDQSCEFYQIGGSTNNTDLTGLTNNIKQYYPNNSGINKAENNLIVLNFKISLLNLSLLYFMSLRNLI